MEKFKDFKYKRIDIEQYRQEVTELLEEFASSDSVEEQLEVFDRLNKRRNEVQTMIDLCYVRYTLNTKDDYYVSEIDYCDEIEPEVLEIGTLVYKTILDSKYLDAFEEKVGSLFIKKAKYAIRTFSEEVKEDLVKENKLTSEYTKVLASAEIDYKGEKRNLSQMGPFMVVPEREDRKEASEKYYGFLAGQEETLDRIYDELVHIRHSIATKLGFKNFVELGYIRMNRLDYNADMVANYRKQVLTDLVPIATKLRKRQAKRLGLEELEYYDVNYIFKSGNPKPQGQPEWIVEQGMKMYDELSPETGEFFHMMMDRELMDLVAKPGKSGGGYCVNLPSFGVPFVFSNFNGTDGDVVVLTHEIGHAFQGHMSNHITVPELNDPTYESAEIHSMSMEFFTYPWMENFFGKDIDKYRFNHMSDGLLFIPYGVLVDHFQHEVYENPNMTPEQRRLKWRELEKMYLPLRTYNGNEYLEQGGYWQRQSHIYEDPFYYIDYTLAQVCAYQFYVKDLKDHENAWADYVKLCSAGGSKAFLGLVELAGLKSPFEDGTLKEVMTIFDKKLEAIDDSQF